MTQCGYTVCGYRVGEQHHRQTDTRLPGVFSPISLPPFNQTLGFRSPSGPLALCVHLCVLWVGKLSTHSLDSCQSQTHSASPPPPPPILFLSPPTHFWDSASPRGLKQAHTPTRSLAGDLLYPEFPRAISGSTLPCSPHFTPRPAEFIVLPQQGNHGCGLDYQRAISG